MDFWRIFSSRVDLACDLLIQSFATSATTETLESEKFHCSREYEDKDEIELRSKHHKKCEENGTQSEGRDSHAGSEVDDEQSGIGRSFKT